MGAVARILGTSTSQVADEGEKGVVCLPRQIVVWRRSSGLPTKRGNGEVEESPAERYSIPWSATRVNQGS